MTLRNTCWTCYLSTLRRDEEISLAILLGEIRCGRLPELWDAWRQGRALPADTPFSLDLLIGQILSLIDPPGRLRDHYDVCRVFNSVFRTGAANVDASIEVLSLLLRRCESFSNYVGSIFTWDFARCRSFPHAYFLAFGGDRTIEILEVCGADPNRLRVYAMESVPEIPYWEELLKKGVGDIVLNLVLLDRAIVGSIKCVKYLVSKGASVNYHHGATDPSQSGWTALAYSTQMGNTETALFLLSKGADVLQDPVDYVCRKYTISQLATSIWDRPHTRDLASTLAQVECEERAKRGKAQGMSPSSFRVHVLTRYGPLVVDWPEPRPEPQPGQILNHVVLAIGVFLAALAAIHHLSLHCLGRCLRNRRLIFWACGICYRIVCTCLSALARAPLVWRMMWVGLAIEHLSV